MKKAYKTFRRYHPDKYYLRIWTFTVTLTLKTVIQKWHIKLQLVITHHYTKFGCKGLTNSRDMEESYFWGIWPHSVTLTLKIGTQPFPMTLQVMMMHQHTKLHQERLSGSEDIVWTNIISGFEPSLWPWPSRQQSKIVTQHSGSWWSTTKPNLVAKGSQIEEIRKKQSCGMWPCTVTLTLKESLPNWSFPMTLRLYPWHFG